jgi:hypothetical protein
MVNAIESSSLVMVCITPNYVKKVAGKGPNGLDDACKFEFDYARRRLGAAKLIPIVMDPSVRDPCSWDGHVGFALGQRLYVDCSDELPDNASARKVEELSKMIEETIGAKLALDDDRVASAGKLPLDEGGSSNGACARTCAQEANALHDTL